MRRLFTIALLTATAALGLPAAAGAACAGADAQPTSENVDSIAVTTLCLINEQRTARGLAELEEQTDLTQASQDYSEQMIEEQFFAHVSPAGSTLTARLTDSGYLGGAGAWVVGENIAWGESYLGTPGSIVTAWMNSAGHRANILSPDFDEIGLGIAIGVPTGNGDGGTYTTDFGHRDLPARESSDPNADDTDNADDPAVTSATRKVTGGRTSAGSRNVKTKRKHAAKATCRAVGHRGAARQSQRALCLKQAQTRISKRRKH